MQSKQNLMYLIIFFLSGIPALVYQVAWQRILGLYFGVDIYATSIIVSTYMLGLGLGSLVGGKVADSKWCKPWLYGGLELVLALFGFFSAYIFSKIGALFSSSPISLMIMVNFLLLLLPTSVMGMTFPVMSSILLSSIGNKNKTLAKLYSLNTMGAAIGALLSSYLLIGIMGLKGSTYFAASVNILLAIIVFFNVFNKEPVENEYEYNSKPSKNENINTHVKNIVLLFSFLSGFIALGYEIVWYRVLSCILHGTVYVFGTILFFHLFGIAVGAYFGHSKSKKNYGINHFVVSQLFIVLWTYGTQCLIGWCSSLPGLRHLISASFFTSFHPSLELVSGHADIYSLYSLFDCVFWPLFLLFVPSALMGYGFPFLLSLGTEVYNKVGKGVGVLYFFNIIGATIGASLFGFVFIHYWGTESAFKILLVCGIIINLVFILWDKETSDSLYNSVGRKKIAAILCVCLLISIFAFPSPTQIIKSLHAGNNPSVDIEIIEDRAGTVALRTQKKVFAFPQEKKIINQTRLYIDGSNHGVVYPNGVTEKDFCVQLALAAQKEGSSLRVLSIGLGDGRMVETALTDFRVSELIVVELSSVLKQILMPTTIGKKIFSSDRLSFVINDGRKWLLSHPDEKFDIIMMWPLNAAHAYYGNLFSVEFFGLLKSHLNNNGIIHFKSVDCFSTALTASKQFKDILRIGSSGYLTSDSDMVFNNKLLGISYRKLKTEIQADKNTILKYAKDAPLNYDLFPRCEYYITYAFRDVLQTRKSSSLMYKELFAENYLKKRLMH